MTPARRRTRPTAYTYSRSTGRGDQISHQPSDSASTRPHSTGTPPPPPHWVACAWATSQCAACIVVTLTSCTSSSGHTDAPPSTRPQARCSASGGRCCKLKSVQLLDRLGQAHRQGGCAPRMTAHDLPGYWFCGTPSASMTTPYCEPPGSSSPREAKAVPPPQYTRRCRTGYSDPIRSTFVEERTHLVDRLELGLVH